METNPLRHGFEVFQGYVSGNVDYFSHVDGFGNHDWWDGESNREAPGYVTHLVNDHAVAFIEEQAESDRPFFLYVAHEAPHFPYQGPDDVAFRVVGERIPETREPEQVRRAYREMVEEMDTGIGAILDTLGRLDLAERTFVFFLSDNGATPAGSNGPLRGFKTSLWEGGHRVPALAWWPGGIGAAAASGAVMTSIDLAATVLDVADVLPPADRPLDGVSLLPHLLGGAAPAGPPAVLGLPAGPPAGRAACHAAGTLEADRRRPRRTGGRALQPGRRPRRNDESGRGRAGARRGDGRGARRLALRGGGGRYRAARPPLLAGNGGTVKRGVTRSARSAQEA